VTKNKQMALTQYMC